MFVERAGCEGDGSANIRGWRVRAERRGEAGGGGGGGVGEGGERGGGRALWVESKVKGRAETGGGYGGRGRASSCQWVKPPRGSVPRPGRRNISCMLM